MEKIINVGMEYWLNANGKLKKVSCRKVWEIFTGWEKAGRTIYREQKGSCSKGLITWIWVE